MRAAKGEATATETKTPRGRAKKARNGGAATTIANVVQDIEAEIEAKRRESDEEDPPVTGHVESGRNSGPKDSSGGDSSSSSSSSSDDGHRDSAALRALWTYRATKEWHPKPLPQPFKLTNPRVTKSPKLWPLLFDVLKATHADFVTARDLDGELTRAFNECMISFYQVTGGG